MKRSAQPVQQIPPRRVWFRGAQKWFTGIVTSIAAVMTLALNAKSLGLSGWLGILAPNVADHAAHRIVLLPRLDTLRSLGDSASIVATVTDARGSTLVGAMLRWKSSDSTVASVDSTGTIIARAPGRASIEVSVREVVATAAVLVRQQPVDVLVLGDSSVTLADGDSVRLVALAVDARRHPIRGLDPEWHASDSAVLRVGASGAVAALRPGRARVTARVGELIASVPVDVVLTPALIAVRAGDAQRGLAGRALSEPVVLQVVTRAEQPVPGIAVALATEDGEGAVVPSSATTDAQGRVRVQWTLGSRAGAQRLFGRVATIDSAVVVVADADPVAGNTRVEIISTELRGIAGRPTEQPARVRVTDSSGVALAGVRVAWSALEEGKADGWARTDSSGIAQASWTLGRRAGAQRLLVQVGNARYVKATTLRATADAGAAKELRVEAGGTQSVAAGSALPKAIVVSVRDSLGNVVPGAELRAVPSAGSVADSVITTGVDGRASVRWTLGPKAGVQRLALRLATGTPRLVVPATAKAAVTKAPVTARGAGPRARSPRSR